MSDNSDNNSNEQSEDVELLPAVYEASLSACDKAMAVVGVDGPVVLGGSPVRGLHTVRSPKDGVVMLRTSGLSDPVGLDMPLGCGIELFALDDLPALSATPAGNELLNARAHVHMALLECLEVADNLRGMLENVGPISFEIELADETFTFAGVNRERWTHPESGKTGVLFAFAVDGAIGPTPSVENEVVEGLSAFAFSLPPNFSTSSKMVQRVANISLSCLQKSLAIGSSFAV
eukprot:TRINITY_DN669_c0_g1_i1.p1 TRINITY_DN669_c0_g1~~TRINITY_DN669_c0_g1_i1.p1  ORF type:complete len:247 (+),score=28.12 TRINITY_DN669_c0_g1_i1:44-742(+)